MTNLLRAVSRSLAARPAERHDDWHLFQGNQYWNNVLTSWEPNHEGIGSDFANLVGKAFKGNAIVFACELTRMGLLSQARPAWRRLRRSGRGGDLFGNDDLSVLENPWPGGTFASLASRMELDAAFGGTAFVGRRQERPDRLLRMRPDWVTMVLGSDAEPDAEAQFALDADFLGIMYHPGGKGSGREPKVLLADEVAVWAPIPDPMAAYRGIPWPTAALREVDSDVAATMHKAAFFERGATPQMILSLDPSVKREEFQKFNTTLESRHAGVSNAYRTLVLQGVTPHVVGKDLHQLDFKVTQGAGETRIAAGSGVHPVVAALSEGMAGSSLNAGNFKAACRLVADRTLRPLWASMFASLQTIMWEKPSDAELWYPEREISFLQEDRKDAAEIEQLKAQTIGALVREGFEPRSVIAAVEAEDMNLLVHSGLLSVQLQAPGSAPPKSSGGLNGARPAITVGGKP
ncbi:phage portal protein [Micromonospora inyonensis]|uniref:Phage portal protein n=1 Tax=Micromonospora inyonensis TaxID=47866 RepID=A0A1C6RX88_9ACTN|nr:phage portal protein [Micromonospora inyonensis]SCL21683.1 Phage portal protein [Micromonospora inyonensis]